MLEHRSGRILAMRGFSGNRWAVVLPPGLALGVILAAFPVAAHQSHEAQVEQLNQTIDQDSTDLSALLRRADLHRRQGLWSVARDDYQTIAVVSPGNAAGILGSAQLALDQREFENALAWTERLPPTGTPYPLAWLIRARAFAGLQRQDAAAISYDMALDQLAKPLPEHYLEYARVLASDPDEVSTEHAIAVLDEGNVRLNNPVSLHSHALDLEIANGHLDSALARIDQLIERSGNLPNWRLRQAELLILLERNDQAREILGEILAYIQQLTPQRRYSKGISAIADSSQRYLDQLDTDNLVSKRHSS